MIQKLIVNRNRGYFDWVGSNITFICSNCSVHSNFKCWHCQKLAKSVKIWLSPMKGSYKVKNLTNIFELFLRIRQFLTTFKKLVLLLHSKAGSIRQRDWKFLLSLSHRLKTLLLYDRKSEWDNCIKLQTKE